MSRRSYEDSYVVGIGKHFLNCQIGISIPILRIWDGEYDRKVISYFAVATDK